MLAVSKFMAAPRPLTLIRASAAEAIARITSAVNRKILFIMTPWRGVILILIVHNYSYASARRGTV
jgi:hypothetical protein